MGSGESRVVSNIHMRVLKILIARSIWLFPISYMNPQGKAVDADVIALLKKTYQFQKYPSSQFDFDSGTKALTFSGGKFKAGYEANGKERYITVDLVIYKDGLVANTTSSTKDGDSFLAEGLRLVVNEFGLVPPDPTPQKIHLNEMDIQIDRSINVLNPKLAQLAGRIADLRTETPKIAFEFSGVSFLPQPDVQTRISGFHIERKINTDWSKNIYYTKAPLQTETHLKLLEEFEALLSQ